MQSKLIQSSQIQQLLDRVSGVGVDGGNPRIKQIARRIVSDLYSTIDEFNVTPEEFWGALNFLQQGAGEFGLIAPGLGIDRFLDIRSDELDKMAGVGGGTPRAIEGPLYVHGAPLSRGYARIDDGTDRGEVLIMHGQVLDTANKPVAGAIVDVWHANTAGGYSHFDASQSAYNNRHRIETGADGRYAFRSVVPSGYAVPPQGATERLMSALGRHGKRPAHIHFFISAPGFRHLTTQVNLADDPLVDDDFAHATRDGLVAPVEHRVADKEIYGLAASTPYAEMKFDFVLPPSRTEAEAKMHARKRVSPAESASK